MVAKKFRTQLALVTGESFPPNDSAVQTVASPPAGPSGVGLDVDVGAFSPALMIVISLVPFSLLPLAHLASNSVTATGFYHEELPYYVANGRAAFERGNGFTYPNPYDPDSHAPSIYAHWLLWGLGVLPTQLSADPGDVLLSVAFFAAVVFAGMTWRLVSVRCLRGTQPHLWFLLAMWGGGLLSAGGLIAGLIGHTDSLSSLLQFDPGRGLWFLSWGRNAVFPTEAVYHALVAGCWICEMKGRRIGGTILCAALATTHPWSGLELLLVLNLWRCVWWGQCRDRTAAGFLCLAVLMLAAFLFYYRVWLPQFPQHQKLQDSWELNWSLSWLSAGLAYSLVLIPAGIRLIRSRTAAPGFLRLAAADQFLLCAVFVAVGLAFHDRFVRPVQPLHFTRGYIWMPLFLIGLPVMQEWSQQVLRRGLIVRLSAVGVMLLAVADDCVFAVFHSQRLLTAESGYHLEPADRAMLQTLHTQHTGAVVLSESETLNYLMPTYAAVRPWLGHPFNTPDVTRRRRIMAGVFRGNSVDVALIPQDIDCLLVLPTRSAKPLQESNRWVRLNSHNPRWDLWGQIEAGSGTATSHSVSAAR